ncbi:hypothetical protein [Methylomonas sp. ZR1]|uniref:hypothetical protein n=1 Tax=Methylomonas sp. ZR1 TaxID=1797072 RepID=UPI0014911E06|nr:hypothetical protein [Methylomonas sp. ZR1]NOV29196.1 hypothetical protein [Methylomonas sp. ZR1]
MSKYATTKRIAELRSIAQHHFEQAKQSPRYEVYFSEQQKARLADAEADQLELELQGGEA